MPNTLWSSLDLQPLLNRAYEMGYYWQDDPAQIRLEPPLSEEERTFAAERLRDAGLIDEARL